MARKLFATRNFLFKGVVLAVGQSFETTELHARDLLAAKLASAESSSGKTAGHILNSAQTVDENKSLDSMSVPELKDLLAGIGINFSARINKIDLLALAKEHVNESFNADSNKNSSED